MSKESEITRERLAEFPNEDLAREYQAIIAYVVYSRVLKGAEFMNIARQLEIHAKQELEHALIISQQIDYLGKMPTVESKAVRTSKDAHEMVRRVLVNEQDHQIDLAAALGVGVPDLTGAHETERHNHRS